MTFFCLRMEQPEAQLVYAVLHSPRRPSGYSNPSAFCWSLSNGLTEHALGSGGWRTDSDAVPAPLHVCGGRQARGGMVVLW